MTSRLVVLGDSVAAGAGITSIEARFGGRLATALGEDWSVVVLALRGRTGPPFTQMGD